MSAGRRRVGGTGQGPAEHGASGPDGTYQGLGSGWAMRAPGKLGAVFIQGLKE